MEVSLPSKQKLTVSIHRNSFMNGVRGLGRSCKCRHVRLSISVFVFTVSQYKRTGSRVLLDKAMMMTIHIPAKVLRYRKKNTEGLLASLTNLVGHLRKVFTYKDCFHVRGTTSYYVTTKLINYFFFLHSIFEIVSSSSFLVPV